MSSIHINWAEVNYEKWGNETTRVLREIFEDTENKNFKKVAERLGALDEDGALVDYYEEILNDYEPMMNYGHILETTPADEDILEVALKTNCSVMYNDEQCRLSGDTYYIVLNGGGMDLSQDIGLAYIILEKWIPEDFIRSVSSQEGLSISKVDFKILKKEIIAQCKRYSNIFEEISNRWEAK